MPEAGVWAYHPALDGVRALAVTAVLFFHARPDWLGGGFLGVDAFFVLSGFLITGLLLAEHRRTGRVKLLPFWGRRARRLLPALLVVLLATVAIGRLTLPDTELTALRWDALAALGYVANWRMTYRGGDYFTETAPESLLQHTWSLGIEEQFYLVWPLLVVLALRARRPRAAVLAVCLAGTVASTAVSTVLYRGEVDPARAYYGTDARASALLVGCALAALLAGRDPAAAQPGRRRPLVLAFTAVLAAAVVGVAWAAADGRAGWLYQGGLTLLAVAVAVVLAHLVTAPAGWGARLLSLPPVVWLGRVSYGVYLWHWPLFGLLTADRTGRTGVSLVVLRFGATLLAAALTFYLVELPVRRVLSAGRPDVRLAGRGRLAGWLAGHGWLPGLAHRAPGPGRGRAPGRTRRWVPGTAVALAATGTAFALTATVVVVATVAPPSLVASAEDAPPLAPGAEGSDPTATPDPRLALGVAPTDRPGRRPGALPRVTVLGDSVAWTLGAYLPADPALAVANRAMPGCGIARLPDIWYGGGEHTNYKDCDKWDLRWRWAVRTDDPDLAVVLLDRWELMDRKLNGRYQHVGEPQYDAYLLSEINLAVSVAAGRGARVVLLTAPYTRRLERPDGGLWPEDTPARVDAWNRLLTQVASEHWARPQILDLNRVVCPDGEFTWTINGLRVRSDGLHLTQAAVQKVIAPWLLPQLVRLATTPP
ncbi:MAG TPA: acyltransferase family protein [Micromonosporaceae bacterium]|nr:acyltransferase family protein [Micromonosporaceae bacterium]